MLDFNDSPSQGREVARPASSDGERERIRSLLLDRLDSVLAILFPAGKKRRNKFVIGDIQGNPGDSLEIVLDGEKAGLWTDRATGDGGDVFAVIAGTLGVDVQTEFPRVLARAADLLGLASTQPVRRKRKAPPTDDLGPETAKWDYLDAAGRLIGVVYRYDPPGRGKEFRPWDAKRRKMAPPEPRPLYNQPGLATATQVVLVEGE
ncbi:phage/plasmid primase, P4 family, partial [Ralstonia pseudosolanacearum]